MKKLFALLLSLAVLTACALPALADEPVRIVFWHSMTAEAGEAVTRAVDEFNATIGAEKGIVVEAVYQGTYAEATQKLNAILLAKTYDELPDVMQMDATGKVAYFTSGQAYFIDDQVAAHPETDLSMMLDVAMGNWNYSGTQLGLPFATSTTVLYYNKTLLDAAGVDAPATLADIAALAGKLPEDVTVYACVPNTPLLANWLGQLGSDLVNEHNGSEGNATALACIENNALAVFLTEWKSLASSGALLTGSASTDEFVAGKLALMTSSSSNIASINAKVGGNFEVGVAFYPRVNEDASAGATVSGSCLVMFNTGKTDAAWELMTWLTGAEVQADLAVNSGYIPSNMLAMETAAWTDLVAAAPAFGVGFEQLAATPAAMRSVTVGPSADFYYAIQDCVTEMINSDLGVDETVELFEDELGGLLERYSRTNP